MRSARILIIAALGLTVLFAVVGLPLLVLTGGLEQHLKDKTLWDWMDLLIIPFSLAVIIAVMQLVERTTDRDIARDRSQQETLHRYLDGMGTLINEKGLDSESTVQVMRARTVTTIRTLSWEHNTGVFA